MRKRMSRLNRREEIVAYAFLLPTLLGLLIFRVLPIFATFILSLANWRMMGNLRWIGLLNYVEMFKDPTFFLSMKNTIIFTVVSVPGSLIFALLVALKLNENIPGKATLRTIYFLPYITMITAVTSVFLWIFHPQGIVTRLLFFAQKGETPNLLLDKRYVIYTLSVVQVWRTMGYSLIIYLAGLQTIPVELYESADVDGATSLTKFFHITWPMLTPTTFFLVITGLISSFQAFDLVYAMTEGGPGVYSHVIAYYIYRTGFKFFRFGFASAQSVILFIIILIITLIQWRGQQSWVVE